VLVVLTEWREFAAVEPESIQQVMVGSAVVDARNVLDPGGWENAGFAYRGTGF
jgi:UDPglucose 6-dehydrogenase